MAVGNLHNQLCLPCSLLLMAYLLWVSSVMYQDYLLCALVKHLLAMVRCLCLMVMHLLQMLHEQAVASASDSTVQNSLWEGSASTNQMAGAVSMVRGQRAGVVSMV